MDKINSNPKTIKSANLHLTGACNYRCEHCFDRCLTHRFLKPEEWMPVINYLKEIGIEKINFAGGEPTLYPYLKELSIIIKRMGFRTSIVSNGSMMTNPWFEEMEGLIDWVGLSIDSPDESDEIAIGRHANGSNHLNNVVRVAEIARNRGMKVKLNITVVRRSFDKDFRSFIRKVNPDRVKAFRALTLKNANDDVPDTWSITDEQFACFRRLHEEVPGIVFEDNDDMVCSYLMFDPMGRWMIDKDYEKNFLPFEALLREGIGSNVDLNRYYGRNAVYEW